VNFGFGKTQAGKGQLNGTRGRGISRAATSFLKRSHKPGPLPEGKVDQKRRKRGEARGFTARQIRRGGEGRWASFKRGRYRSPDRVKTGARKSNAVGNLNHLSFERKGQLSKWVPGRKGREEILPKGDTHSFFRKGVGGTFKKAGGRKKSRWGCLVHTNT